MEYWKWNARNTEKCFDIEVLEKKKKARDKLFKKFKKSRLQGIF